MSKNSGSIEKTALLVLGMHRSGTSALARGLSFHGFALPSDLLPPQPDNPKGFWEPRAVVRLNETILGALGASWDRPGPFLLPDSNISASRERLSRATTRRWLEDAIAALDASYQRADRIVLKDPRIALFLPLWRAALAAAGYGTHMLLIVRNPLEVAASLRQRNALPLRQSFLLWQTYNLAALDFAADTNMATVCYEHLVEAPIEAIGAALGCLKLGVPAADAAALAELRGFIARGERHHVSARDDLSRSPLCADQVRALWDLLTDWNARGSRLRKKAAAGLVKSLDDAVLLAGAPKRLELAQVQELEAERDPPTPKPRPPQKVEPGAPDTRLLVLHYHLFKNAGTSVDEILIRNFGSAWATAEFPPSGKRSNVAAVEAYLRERPTILALSSHTALLPVPKLEKRAVLPVIFIRHPVDRLRSAYEFERRQEADTPGSRLAKAHDFTGYLRALLDAPGNRQARNFQAHRLAFNESPECGSEDDRARRALDSLPFVGLVEAFDASLQRLAEMLKSRFTNFEVSRVRKNASRGAYSLKERLAETESEIGSALYGELLEANGTDLQLFETVSAGYARQPALV